MVRKPSSSNVNPSLDAGLGLIFRLNNLWTRADRVALAGDMNKWNFVLDRIYSNLLYRHKLTVEYDSDDPETKKVIDVKIDEPDHEVFVVFRWKIKKAKYKILMAKKKKNKKDENLAREKLYQIMMAKDIWLRKLMQDRKLYMRETEFNPANAMWGG